MDTITLILKIDVLYSAVMAMTTLSENSCTETNKNLSVSIYVLVIVLGWAYMITLSVVLQIKDPAYKFESYMIVAFVLVAICYPLHILLNNSLPLDCVFLPSESAGNTTTTLTNDTDTPAENSVTITRLVFTLFNFITLTIISILFSIAYLTKRLEKLMRVYPSGLEYGYRGGTSVRKHAEEGGCDCLYKCIFEIGDLITEDD